MENTLENIGLKNVSVDFLDSEIKNLFVVQGDTRTRGLLVRVKDNKGNTVPLSDEYELRLYAKRSGEEKLLYSVAEKVGDRYKVYLTSDMLSKTGTLKIQLALYKGDVSLIQSKQSSIPIYPSMTCQFELGQDNVIDIVKIQESLKGFEKEIEKLKNLDGLEGLNDFKKSETERQQAEEQRKQSEEQRVVEETNRVSNEQLRVENEKQRVNNEQTRVDNEKTRVANEQARQEAETVRNNKLESLSTLETERKELLETWKNEEASRVQHESTREENEKIRKISETVRDDNETKRKLEEDTRVQQENARVEAEKTRKSDEQVRSQSEKTRQEQEETRQRQEEERTKAEQQRSTKDTERDVTFKNWDIKIKSLSGLPDKLPEMPKIEKATETTAGVVKLKGLSEEDDTAVSYSLYNKSITDISSNVDNKLNEKEQAFSGKIEEQNTQLSVHDKSIKLLETKTDSLSSQVTGLSTSVDEKISKQNTDINSKLEQQNTTVADKLSEQDSKVDTKLKEYNANIEKNTTGISDINNKLLEQDKTIQGQDTKINGINEKLSTNDTDIKGLKDTTQSLTTKAEKLAGELDTKATKEHTHTIADVTDLQTTLDGKAEKIDVDDRINRIENHVYWTDDITNELTNASEYLMEWRNFEFLPAHSHRTETPTLRYEGKDSAKILTLKSGDGKFHYVELSKFNKRIDFLLLWYKDREYNFIERMADIFADMRNLRQNDDDTISAIKRLGLYYAKCREVKVERIEDNDNATHIFEIEFIDRLEIKEEGYTKANKNHTHKIADVEGLQSTLDDKASADSVAKLEKKVDGKADKTDLSSLKAKVNNLSTDKISNKNGGSLSFWAGTQSQYNSIYSKDSNTIYFITE